MGFNTTAFNSNLSRKLQYSVPYFTVASITTGGKPATPLWLCVAMKPEVLSWNWRTKGHTTIAA